MQFIYNWIRQKVTELAKYFLLIFVSNKTKKEFLNWVIFDNSVVYELH